MFWDKSREFRQRKPETKVTDTLSREKGVKARKHQMGLRLKAGAKVRVQVRF